jgi:hypothetical protein
MPHTQTELTTPSPLLRPDGSLVQAGWARAPLLDCNLEQVAVYPAPFRFLQRFRIKRWDYYGVTTPQGFFSVTLADLGYAGQSFVYTIDFETGEYHEESLTIPFGRGVFLPRGSTTGRSYFSDGKTTVSFETFPERRDIAVTWPDFNGQPLKAEFSLRIPPQHESTVMVIPIRRKRFYFNRKVNCMPASGFIQIGDERLTLRPDDCLGNLDWGRGVWEYRSFWVWASASGFLPADKPRERRSIGLNLGYGFGDTSAATENTLILGGRVNKLGQVDFDYDPRDFKRPWHIRSPDGRVNLSFTPFVERIAKTNLVIITSKVHQLFGRYAGTILADDGEEITIDSLIGFAEEHHARW